MEQLNGFSAEEHIRYARHSNLPGFGWVGQHKLRAAKVLVIGAGGLGAPLLLYLSAAGIGHIGIIDADRVSLSNLQRQVLYTTTDVGILKVEAAKNRLAALNPHITYTCYPFELTCDNALEIVNGYDVVADGSDNFPTRYLVNDACVLLGKPLVYGSIFRYEGQVSVFNYVNHQGVRGPNYRNLYPEPPAPGTIPSCTEGGVLGVLPGIVGSMQANEVIKIVSQTGIPLSGKVALIDAFTGQTHSIRIPEQAPYPVDSLIDYEHWCGITPPSIPEISPAELYAWIQYATAFLLIDVREIWEFEEQNIGGQLIPLGVLPQRLPLLPVDRPIVFLCEKGVRSITAVQLAYAALGQIAAYSLAGGLQALRAFNPNFPSVHG